jgi:hypothetical protein
MKDKKLTVAAIGAVLAAAIVCAQAVADKPKAKDRTSKTAESSVTTNDNGSVSRLFTESTVTTNGNMVTERRRETRTNMDMDGNVLETSTSEYAQSYPVGDDGVVPLSSRKCDDDKGKKATGNADSFLGLKFGEKFSSTNFVEDADYPDFLRAEFKPKKPLDGFDDYYVYVTPKSHKVAMVYACAKEAVDAGASWRRHYLIEALEKRYGTWARLCSWWKPCYQFEVGPYRHVKACLADATQSYGTVIVAWDDAIGSQAVQEKDELREAARKSAAEKRGQRVNAAADAF